MNTPTNKKPILILLAFVIVLVWANFFFRVRNSFQPQQNSITQLQKTEKISNDVIKNISLTFIGNFRNPFLNTLKPQIQKKQQKKQPKRSKALIRDKTPTLTLRGIVGKTAMLEMDNQLYFLHQGDSLSGGKLVAVYRDSLIVDYKFNKDTLKVRK